MRGALAGITGAAAMHAFRLLWESATRHEAQRGIFGFDREADIKSARMLNAMVRRRPIPDREAERLGLALHYLYGAALGVGYGALAPRLPQLGKALGLPLGAALWLVADEVPISAAGISNPLRRPPSSHAAALCAHLLFGAVVRYSYRYEAVCS